MHVVWIRRDARVHDHDPLSTAVSAAKSDGGKLIVLYIYDPVELKSDTFHESHLQFINEGLQSLDETLRAHGGQLVYRKGNPIDVLRTLHEFQKLTAVYLHDDVETGAVSASIHKTLAWASANSVRTVRIRQDGVIPEGRPAAGWAAVWATYMHAPPLPPPAFKSVRFVSDSEVPSEVVQTAEQLHIPHRGSRPAVQKGGHLNAARVLNDFLDHRATNYAAGLSSPVSAWQACSRLSAYLSWGHVSLRTVVYELSTRQTQARNRTTKGKIGLRDFAAFAARLRWRSHFTQKMYDMPMMEFRNVCSVYDGLRDARSEHEKSVLADRYQAWIQGRTGFPMVDAVMRALTQSGWINFRMRAMVVSFATHILWLDWKQIASVAARLFIDFAPGIHYPQLQMQAGTTGINAVRIYNPTKQLRDHDKDGVFVKEFVKELNKVPTKYIAEPWTMPKKVQTQASCVIGNHYPAPIIDFAEAYRRARSEFARIRGSSKAKMEAEGVFRQHGSRKRPRRGRANETKETVQEQHETIRKCSLCRSTDHIKGRRCPQFEGFSKESDVQSKKKFRQSTFDIDPHQAC